MPSPPVTPEGLRALAVPLEALRDTARAGAEEALGHLPEVGDRQSQGALDAYLEQLADTLRAIDAEATELASRLRIAAQAATGTPPPTAPSTSGSMPSPTHRRGLFR